MSSGRGRHKDPYKHQVMEAMAEKFPGFRDPQMSMIRNPGYGLQLSSEAISWLESKGITPPGKVAEIKFKKAPKRKRENKISIRLNDKEKQTLKELAKKNGYPSVQKYIENLIEKENERCTVSP